MDPATITSPSPPAWSIDPAHAGPVETVADIWRSRRMLRFIASRALRKIYRRTILGWMWLFIIPLFPIALRTVIFGGLLAVPTDGVPYLLFLTGGTVVWDLFALGLMWGTRGLEMNRGVADQVYVPGIVLTLGNMGPAVLDFLLKLGAFLLMAAVFWTLTGVVPIHAATLHWTIAALALSFGLAGAIALFTSVWGEAGRDTRFVLGQVLGVWYLLTPVLYPVSAAPASWRPWLALNPMAPIVETFKWSLFGVGTHDPRAFAMSAATVAIVGVLGLMYFARNEAAASDAR